MKVFKKIIAACLACVAAMSMVVTANADAVEMSETNTFLTADTALAQVYQAGFSLVSEEEIVDKEGEDIIIYRVRVFKRSENDESSVMSANASTTDTYFLDYTAAVQPWPLKEPQEWVYMWIKGSFKYDGNTCYVSGVDGGAEQVSPGITFVDNPRPVGKSDQGSNFLFGNKYAIVRKDVTMTNGFSNNKRDFHLSLDVNRNGEYHTDPKGLTPEKI